MVRHRGDARLAPQRCGARVVVSGHLHTRRTDWIDGVRFEEVSLGISARATARHAADAYLRRDLARADGLYYRLRENVAW